MLDPLIILVKLSNCLLKACEAFKNEGGHFLQTLEASVYSIERVPDARHSSKLGTHMHIMHAFLLRREALRRCTKQENPWKPKRKRGHCFSERKLASPKWWQVTCCRWCPSQRSPVWGVVDGQRRKSLAARGACIPSWSQWCHP